MTQRDKSFEVCDRDFRTSSFTNPGGIINVCVAVARSREGVAIRDTEDKNRATMFFTTAEWDAFIKGAKNGEFDV